MIWSVWETRITVREVKGRGFWVEIVKTTLSVFKDRGFLNSDGSLMEEMLMSPVDIIEDGLFQTRRAAVKEASRFARLASRSFGYGKVTVTNADGGAA